MKMFISFRNHKIMKSLIIAALLCLATVTTGCEENKTTASTQKATEQREVGQGQPLTTTSGDPKGECEAQTGTWEKGKCKL